MDQELWQTIPDFPYYQISNYGRVYNQTTGRLMRTSTTQFGHVKISLLCDWGSGRYTRSVALLVAEAFVEPPDDRCDHVMILDGNPSNVAYWNLAWRPRWFVWKYAHQLKTPQPSYFYNLPVVETTHGRRYNNIIEAGMTEGLLFNDIWKSTFDNVAYFPNRLVFKINRKKINRIKRNARKSMWMREIPGI